MSEFNESEGSNGPPYCCCIFLIFILVVSLGVLATMGKAGLDFVSWIWS